MKTVDQVPHGLINLDILLRDMPSHNAILYHKMELLLVECQVFLDDNMQELAQDGADTHQMNL